MVKHQKSHFHFNKKVYYLDPDESYPYLKTKEKMGIDLPIPSLPLLQEGLLSGSR